MEIFMAEDIPLLQGKVAKILNEREVAINIGRKHGVAKGMRFAILAPTPEEISDPETGEVLDVIDRTKVLVQATEVREKVTICSTYRTTKIPAGAFNISYEMGRLLEPPREIPETLRIEDASLPAPLSPEESYVKIGDRVKQVEEI
jgi:hypothetical protein